MHCALVCLVLSIYLENVAIVCAKLEPSKSTSKVGSHYKTATNFKRAAIDKRLQVREGQLESFSSDATGLGDMSATDNGQPIQKRSLVGLVADSSSFSSKERGETAVPTILRSRRPIVIRRRHFQPTSSSIDHHLSQAYLLNRWPRLEIQSRHREDDWENLGEPVEASIEDDQEAAATIEQRLLSQRLAPFVRKNRQLGTIVISRRTAEELLEAPPAIQMDSLPATRIGQPAIEKINKQQDSQGDEHIDEHNFPLLGEFGSRVSLLTTRKTQPSAANHLYSFSTPAYLQTVTGVVGGGRTKNSMLYPWSMAEDLMEDAEPVTSSAQIMSRSLINQLKGFKEEHVKNKELADEDEPPNGHTDATVLVMDLNSNFLPRVARNSFMSR